MCAEIPVECKEYIFHHVRNGLVGIMGLAVMIRKDPGALRELEEHVMHIAEDLKKIGL